VAVASAGHMHVCTLLQTDNRTSTPPLCFFTGQMPFLPPNQQRQSTEGMISLYTSSNEVYSNRKLVVIEEAKIWTEVTFIPICGTVSNEPV